VRILPSIIEELGLRFQYPADIYIFGGSALMLIGSPRVTIDVDYTIKVDVGQKDTGAYLNIVVTGSDEPVQLRTSFNEIIQRL
jgi:hypothetical protein